MSFQVNLFLFFFSVQFTLATNCEVPSENNFTIIIPSNTQIEIVDSNSNYLQQSVICSVGGGWTSISGASWIWKVQNPSSYETVYFRSKFYIYGVPSSGTIQVACDNSVQVYVNGIKVGCSGAGYGSVTSCNILSILKSGLNVVLFAALNEGGPGGLVFKITTKAKL